MCIPAFISEQSWGLCYDGLFGQIGLRSMHTDVVGTVAVVSASLSININYIIQRPGVYCGKQLIGAG